MNRPRKAVLAFVAAAAGAALALLVTGWGTAVASNVSGVFITNDASHAVPVEQQGTAAVNVTNTTVPVHEKGTANVAVDGVVSTRPQIPTTQFSWRNDGSALVSGPDPAGTRYAISSITATAIWNVVFPDPSESMTLVAIPAAADNTCQTTGPLSGPVQFGPSIVYRPNLTTSLTFPQPFVIPPPTAADPVCLITRSSLALAELMIVGYRF